VSSSLHVRIPMERVGVLIGPNGSVKREIEESLGVRLAIDSRTGDVEIELAEGNPDPSSLLRARDIVLAIGRGFSPERAFRLLRDEEALLRIIDLREIFGRSKSDIVRVKGRIIGREGKTRRIIEELTGAYVSVYGHTVAIIGGYEQVQVAEEAIQMLIEGRMHSTVYRFLHRKKREMRRRRALELWERPYE